MIAPTPVLSHSSILPLSSSHCAFTPAKNKTKNKNKNKTKAKNKKQNKKEVKISSALKKLLCFLIFFKKNIWSEIAKSWPVCTKLHEFICCCTKHRCFKLQVTLLTH
jgi:hypothetical protein